MNQQFDTEEPQTPSTESVEQKEKKNPPPRQSPEKPESPGEAKAAETAATTEEGAPSSPKKENSAGKKTITVKKASVLPKDFALRIATRIITINEREMDEHTANTRVADLVYRNLKEPELHSFFLDAIDILLANEETQKYAARIWTSLTWSEENHPEYNSFILSIVNTCAEGHRHNLRESWVDEETAKSFSYFAYLLGECFIQMMKVSADLYDIVTEMFSHLIRFEMTRDLDEKDKNEHQKKNPRKRRKNEETGNLNPKKLYDDVVDFVSHRGDFRSDTLNQKNPNEFILMLADRMRSTRRYVIQDIMNRFALEKKKQLEKELKEREASAEEVIQAARPFNHGLYLYWVEKRYNFKYLAVEKVRITLQVLGFLFGIGSVGASYLGLWELTILESLITATLMFAFAKAYCSRYVFVPFYPKDVTAELEEDVGMFTPVFRKMSSGQMHSFINKQIKQPENNLLLHLLPEYMKYVFAVMPDRSNILMNKEEVNEMLERLESNISKFQRGAS